jgi:hypothetical protein
MIRQSDRRFGGSACLFGNPRTPAVCLLYQAAADLAEVGTEEIVFRICEAIW